MDPTSVAVDSTAPSAIAQIVLYVLVMSTLALIEMCRTRQARRSKWRHYGLNGSMLAAVLPAQIVMSALTAMVSIWVVGHGWGLVPLLAPQHTLLSVLLLLLGLDLGEYTYHRCMHRFPMLWQFHLVHHCDHAVDVSTTLREHPGETVARNSFGIVWVLLLGVPLQVLALRQLGMTVSNLCAHSDLTLPPRLEKAIGWLLITPNQHRIHHHRAQPYTDSNFGDILSIWDRLLGTHRTLARERIRVGLDTHPNIDASTGLCELLRLPFSAPPLLDPINRDAPIPVAAID